MITAQLNRIDVTFDIGLLHRVVVSGVTDVSHVNTASIFRVKVEFDPKDGDSMYL
jgi:hypothetical protein